MCSDGKIIGSGRRCRFQLDYDNTIIFSGIRDYPDNISDIFLGNDYTIVRLSNGEIMGRGCNAYGQLAMGPWPIFMEFRHHILIRLDDETIMTCGESEQKRFVKLIKR